MILSLGNHMMKIAAAFGFVSLLLTTACVPATEGTQQSSFMPNSGMPHESVVSVELFDDTPNIPHLVIFKYYPEKASPAEIAAAPENLCRSIRKKLRFQELMPSEPNHGGPKMHKLQVRCE